MKNKARIKPKRYAYLAGLIDGDGSIGIRYDAESGYQLTTCVYSTCQTLMNWLVKQFGGTFRKVSTEGNRKQKYQWYTSCPEIADNVAEFLVLKKEQGILAQSFIQLGSKKIPEARQDIMVSIQNANQRFDPVSNDLRSIVPDTEPTKINFAYLAGIFDAEGSFTIFRKNRWTHNGRYTSQIRVSNTDARLFSWLIKHFGGYFSMTKRSTRDEGTWCITGRENRVRLMLAFMPYLVVKKERAALLLTWIQTNSSMSSERKYNVFKKMAELNLRGLSPEANTPNLPSAEDKIESDLRSDAQGVTPVTAIT